MTDTDQALRDLAKSASLVYVGLILEIIIAFAGQVIAARFLSVSNFGGVTAGVALLNVGAIFGALGLGSGLSRYLPRIEESQREPLLRGVFLLAIPVSSILGLAVSVSAPSIAADLFHDPSITPSLRIFGAAIPFGAVLTVAIGAFRGKKMPRFRVYVENIVRPLTRLALVVVAALYGLGQTGFAGAYAIPYVLGAIVALWLLARSMQGNIEGQIADRSLLTDVLDYSLPLIFNNSAMFVYRSIDIFLVLYFLNSSAVGVYGVVYAAARLLLLFSTAFNFLGTPIASELEANAGIDEAIGVHRSVLRWLVILSIPTLVPFVFFPADFIATIYRPAYATGAVTLATLAVGFAVHNVLGPNTTLLQALGHSRLLTINTVVAAITNIALNVLLIPGQTIAGVVVPGYGILGAAIATVVAYLLRDLLTIGELYVLTGVLVTSRKVLAPVVTAVPLFGALAVLDAGIPKTILWIVATTAVFGLCYLVAVVAVLGFEPEEVMLVHSVEEKYGIDLGPLSTFFEWRS